ncbi:MAG: hypothetical protein Q7S27_03000 [Nanoarchaeota archaeon]|nr:hypothetical protein [Nanoarchaeota archaeon]
MERHYYDEDNGDILPKGKSVIEVFRRRNGEYDAGFVGRAPNTYIEDRKRKGDYKFVGRYEVPSERAREFMGKLNGFIGLDQRKVKTQLENYLKSVSI